MKNKKFYSDALKYLDLPFIKFDKRHRDYRDFIAQNGGEEMALKLIESRLNETNNYKQIQKRRNYAKQYIKNRKIGNFIYRLISVYQSNYSNKVIKLRSYDTKFVVLKQLQEQNGLKKAFKIIMTDIQTGSKISYSFRNVLHFNNWLKKIVEDNETNLNYGTQRLNNRTLFQLGTAKVELLEGGYRNKKAQQINITLSNGTKFNCFNPISQRNNCALECIKNILNIEFNNREIRKKFNIKASTLIDITDILKIYNFVKTPTDKPLEVINVDIQGLTLNFNEYNYILLYKKHYLVITEQLGLGDKTYDNIKTKRGILAFDLETRPNKSKEFMINNTKAYQLEDTICCVVYKDYKSDELQKKRFVGYYNHNNEYISSCVLFKGFLDEQASKNKFYNVWSHNGSRFDNYFMIKAFYQQKAINEIEKINLRGLSVIGLQYNSHLFKDSCCFMPKSLNELSTAFKVSTPKLTEFRLNGKILSNTELCFYRPELDIKQFLELQKSDVEYWRCYEEYCFADCFSLIEIVQKFNTEINRLIEKMSPRALGYCKMIKYNTIGSHSKGIFTYLNENNCHYKDYCEFFQNFDNKNDDEKLIFVNNFKRGGISHCNKKGKHTKGVVSVDITSQYPASMVQMKVPCGYSKWVDDYDPELYGYYHIKNLEFDNKNFKPTAGSNQVNESSLNWVNMIIEEDFIDSFMLEYLIKNCGLVKFTVVRGLVSKYCKEGSKIFGKYVMTLFEAKAEQDEFKSKKDNRYNPALREVIKLYLNSLSGKLVEDPRKYGTTKFVSDTEESTKSFNGTNIIKTATKDLNILVGLGVMVYSYSKRLLFEYIHMLPEKTNNVIATETDSIYFDKQALLGFESNVKKYDGEYPCKFGNDLGNIKFEKNTDDICYFLGKKFYSIDGHYVIKGISQKTIDDNGKEICLVDNELYETIYNMKRGDNPITRTMKVIKRVFYGITNIYDTTLTRTINSTYDYKEY